MESWAGPGNEATGAAHCWKIFSNCLIPMLCLELWPIITITRSSFLFYGGKKEPSHFHPQNKHVGHSTMHTCQYPARDNLSRENVLLNPPGGLLMSLHFMAYNCCKQRKLWWRWEEIPPSPSTKSASELMDNSKIALWEKCYSSGDHLSLHLMILQPLQAIIHFLYLQFINAVAELLQRSELSNRHATLLPLVMGSRGVEGRDRGNPSPSTFSRLQRPDRDQQGWKILIFQSGSFTVSSKCLASFQVTCALNVTWKWS